MQDLTTAKYLKDEENSQEALSIELERPLGMEVRTGNTKSFQWVNRAVPMLFMIGIVGGILWWQNPARKSDITHSDKHPVDRVIENPFFRALYWLDGQDSQDVQKDFAAKRAARKHAFDDRMQEIQDQQREMMEKQAKWAEDFQAVQSFNGFGR